MAQIHVIGYVTDDLELRCSSNGNSYVRFGLEEPLPYGRVQRYQVWAYGWYAEFLIKRKVKAKSLIEVNGTLLKEEYFRKDGEVKLERLKIIFKEGGPVPPLWRERASKSLATATTPAESSASPDGPPCEDPIDGDRDPLPD